MARPAPDRDDPRTRYTHQAYDVTYGGISPERGVSGRNTLLAGTYRAAFQFVTDATGPARVVGDLPMGVWIDGIINHVSLSSGTFSLVLGGTGGDSDVTLVTALNGDLTEDGPATMTPVYAPLPRTRPLIFTPAGGTPGERVVISVLATSAETGWK